MIRAAFAGRRSGLLLALVVFASSLLAACQSDPPLEVAPSVSLSQLQGKWYEIARLPRMTQADCHGTTAFYTERADGSLGLVNQCNVGSATGKLQTIAMSATVPDRSVPAKLALTVGGYTGDYWILEVGSDYEYAVVGHPSRLYLWILSRTPTLEPSVMSGILTRAEAAHFDTSKLEYTPQPPAGDRNGLETPQGAVPEGPHPSCSLVQGQPDQAYAEPALVAFALLLVAGVRRRGRTVRARQPLALLDHAMSHPNRNEDGFVGPDVARHAVPQSWPWALRARACARP